MQNEQACSSCFGLGFFLVILGTWIPCVYFGVRNLQRAGKSPHWMWVAIFGPVPAFAVFLVSVVLALGRPPFLSKADALRDASLTRAPKTLPIGADDLVAVGSAKRADEKELERTLARYAVTERDRFRQLTPLVTRLLRETGQGYFGARPYRIFTVPPGSYYRSNVGWSLHDWSGWFIGPYTDPGRGLVYVKFDGNMNDTSESLLREQIKKQLQR